MKKILPLFALLALLLVSTAALSDGRPTGLRIGRLVSGGGTNVELDITVTETDRYYGDFTTSVWLGNTVTSVFSLVASQFESNNFSVPLPWAIDWGDGSQAQGARVFRDPGPGPFTGTFAHTYAVPGSYQVTVGDALCCDSYFAGYININSGNVISASYRYVHTFNSGYSTWNFPYWPIAVTANATVTTGTGIPTTNTYGLIALALLLIGTGLLVFRRPQGVAT